MLQSGRIRNPRLQGDNPLFRSKLANIRSGYYQKFSSKNTPPLPELKAKLKNRSARKKNSKYLEKMYNKRSVSLMLEDSSDDGEDESDEENSASASSSSESENELDNFFRKKSPARENPRPEIVRNTEKPCCKLCPDWFNDYATEQEIFITWHDIDIHHKIWHNSKYMPDKCEICCFRAENLTELKNQHDNFPELCKILTKNKTYIRLEEHLGGGGSGRRGRKSRNASGMSNESPLHAESKPTIRKPSSISPKLPKPAISKHDKKLKQPDITPQINIPTFDLTLSPSPDRSWSNRPLASSSQQPPQSPASSVSSSHSVKSNKSSINSTSKSLIEISSKTPSPNNTTSSCKNIVEKKYSSPKNLNIQIPEESSSKDESCSPKPENTKRWTYQDKADVNDVDGGKAEFVCDECNMNEVIGGKFTELKLETHRKLWHSDYSFTICEKCKQRFETITDMNKSIDHKSTCAVYQVGNVMAGWVMYSKRRKRPSAQPVKSRPKKESKTSPNNQRKVSDKEPVKLPDAQKIPEKTSLKVPTKNSLVEKVRKAIPDREIPQYSSPKPRMPAKSKISMNTSTPLEILQERDAEAGSTVNEPLIDDLPILVPCSSPIDNIPSLIFECPLCLKDHPPAQDLFSNCDYSDMIEVPELDTWMPKF